MQLMIVDREMRSRSTSSPTDGGTHDETTHSQIHSYRLMLFLSSVLDISQPGPCSKRSIRAQESSRSLEIDSEWRIDITQANVAPKTHWDASCSITGDCWYWSSSQLFAASVESQEKFRFVVRETNPYGMQLPSRKKWVGSSPRRGCFKSQTLGPTGPPLRYPGSVLNKVVYTQYISVTISMAG